MVFDLELHEAHVGRVCELCDDAQSWKQSVKMRKKNRDISCLVFSSQSL